MTRPPNERDVAAPGVPEHPRPAEARVPDTRVAPGDDTTRAVTGRVRRGGSSDALRTPLGGTRVTLPDGTTSTFGRAASPPFDNALVHATSASAAGGAIHRRAASPDGPAGARTSRAATARRDGARGSGEARDAIAARPRRRRAEGTGASGAHRGWSVAALAVALVVALPMLSVVWLAFNPEENIWPHLFRTVLGSYVSNTLLLMLGVALGTSLIGVGAAWFVTHYEFPARGVLNWALLLPFAVPGYVIAYVYTDLLEFAGPVQSALRALFGWRLANEYGFPEIRSLGGATLMLTLVLYPYVYLLARAAFLEQSASVLEAARVLGGTRRDRFFRVALPMARPAIAVGLAMAMMETLNDYGTVDYFAVRTLSSGLYDVWLRSCKSESDIPPPPRG